MRPNVVIVVLDTARFDDARGTVGGAPVMPALDRLASEGTECIRVSATAPWTLPSHASLFTGTYPSKHGAHAGHKRLTDDLPRLPSVLQTAGYETVAVSNNTWISGEFGFDIGFDTFYQTWQYIQSPTDLGRIARTRHGWEMYRSLARELLSGNLPVNVLNALYGRFGRKRTDSGAAQTNEFVRGWLRDRTDDAPFFLFVNYLEPHLEYRPPKSYTDRFLPADVSHDEAMSVPQDAWGYLAGDVELSAHEFDILRGLYQAELAYVDDRLQELLTTLDTATDRETFVVVTSDHGENIGDHGLMDHQYSLHETLLHVPLVMSGGPFTGTGEVSRPVQLVDLAPTILDTVGVDAPALRTETQGLSFHPDADDRRDYVIAEYLAPQPSMDALEKRVDAVPSEVRRYNRSLRSISVDGRKLIRGSDGSRWLYDLTDDPDECTDVSDTHPSVASTLEQQLETWLDSFDHATNRDGPDIGASTRQRLEELGYLQK
ncbi:sulfatase [Haloarcula halophila]|uniref:sulfatase n=1 Tax=Haloarcula TaxID=2237 RepID=UPI0023E3549C|nr:sulfatase [Halomicroarcula sp. DFY41]